MTKNVFKSTPNATSTCTEVDFGSCKIVPRRLFKTLTICTDIVWGVILVGDIKSVQVITKNHLFWREDFSPSMKMDF